jgi:hypothetical protein
VLFELGLTPIVDEIAGTITDTFTYTIINSVGYASLTLVDYISNTVNKADANELTIHYRNCALLFAFRPANATITAVITKTMSWYTTSSAWTTTIVLSDELLDYGLTSCAYKDVFSVAYAGGSYTYEGRNYVYITVGTLSTIVPFILTITKGDVYTPAVYLTNNEFFTVIYNAMFYYFPSVTPQYTYYYPPIVSPTTNLIIGDIGDKYTFIVGNNMGGIGTATVSFYIDNNLVDSRTISDGSTFYGDSYSGF